MGRLSFKLTQTLKSHWVTHFHFQGTEVTLREQGCTHSTNLKWASLAPFTPSPVPSHSASTAWPWAMPWMTERKDRESRMGRLGFFQSPPKLGNVDKPLPASCPAVAQSSSPLQGQHQGSHLIKATLSPPHPSFLSSTITTLFILTQVCLIGVWESPNE